LEQIVHPAVFELMHRCVESCNAGIAILEAIKLLEAGPMASVCDEIWVVTADPEAQLHRSMEKRGMTEEEALQRMQMQSPQAAKVNQADRVIENNGTFQDLYEKLDEIWQDLQKIYPERVPNPAP
jgi:dephospho-CoA kinase